MISDLDGSLGSDIFSTLQMKGHVLHRARARVFALISMHLLFLILINIIQYA